MMMMFLLTMARMQAQSVVWRKNMDSSDKQFTEINRLIVNCMKRIGKQLESNLTAMLDVVSRSRTLGGLNEPWPATKKCLAA